LDAAEDDAVAILVDRVVAQQFSQGMGTGNVEDGCDLPLVLAMANQTAIAPAAESKRKRIEQDGFACAGLARQNGKTRLEGKIKPIDQDDIADRQLNEHGG